jgi:hypothetical protein
MQGQDYDPNRHSIWVEVPNTDDKWTAAYRVMVKGGEFVVGELRLYPTELPLMDYDYGPGSWSEGPSSVPPGGLTARYAHTGYRFGDWRRETPTLLDRLAVWVGEDGLASIFTSRGIPPEALERLRHEPRRRRRGDEREYARIAALYVDALKQGIRNSVAHVAKSEKMERDTVRDQLHEARRRDILTKPTKEGVAGGELTEKAIGLLGFNKEE